MTPDDLRKLRFTGLDLSPNHCGIVTLDGLGHRTGVHYITDLVKSFKQANPHEGVTAHRYSHPSKSACPDNHLKEMRRLAFVRSVVMDAIEAHGTDFLAIEGYAWEATGREYQIGEVAGVIKADLWERGIPFRVHDPVAVKMYACNNGNAPKEDVMEAVRERWEQDLFIYCASAQRVTEGDLCDAYVLAVMCRTEWMLREGLLSPSSLTGKELQVFQRATDSQPLSVLGRSWLSSNAPNPDPLR